MTDKIKAKNAIKWIDGLYITEERQGTGCLGDSDEGFCCLGLGCKLMELEYNPEEEYSSTFAVDVGLLDDQGTFKGEDFFKEGVTMMTLAEINDEGGGTFKEISVFIKSRPEDIFEEGVADLIKEHYDKA